MKIILETECLLVREILESDAEAIFMLNSNTEVLKYLTAKPMQQITETKEFIENVKNNYASNNVDRIAIIEKNTNTLIGITGLRIITDEINNHTHFRNLGYRFLPSAWGKGYATELATAMVIFFKTNYKNETLNAFVHAENIYSIKIIEKTGFEFQNEFLYKGNKHNWYILKK